jgi:hypothetical protein
MAMQNLHEEAIFMQLRTSIFIDIKKYEKIKNIAVRLIS